MENINKNNSSSSNIKCIRGLRNIIKSSMNKNHIINLNVPINELHSNNILNDNIYNYNINNNKLGANISPINNQINSIKNIKNNIEEIVIKTNNEKNSLCNTNTTPHPIYKQNKKYNLGEVRFNIKKLILSNKNDLSSENVCFSNEDKFNNTLENYKRKSYSQSFRNISNYSINEKRNSTLSAEKRTLYNNTPKMNRYYRKILLNSDSKSKINMKINTNNINNINENTIKNQKSIILDNMHNYPNINNKHKNNYISKINNNEQINNFTNITFDTTAQNEFFNFTDANNQNNESQFTNKKLENEIKLRIKQNKELKKNIELMMDEINKIKQRQEMILQIENNNQTKNNERIAKINNIIKKTYNFLTDFNMIINEQNQQIYQEIIDNLNIFFGN